MTLNKEGLEAARARLEELSGMRNIPSILTRSGREFIAEKAISAYLAALPAPDGLVERLRADAAQLIRMSKATEFGKDLSVRVKAPDLLIASLTEAATVIQTLQRERDEARKKAGKLHDYANMRDMQIVDLRGALEELVDSLTPAEHAAGRDPAYGDVVRNLGKQIGFGALMSCASTEWRLWLEENGYPVGSEFVSGPCRSVLQSDLARARLLLKEGGEC